MNSELRNLADGFIEGTLDEAAVMCLEKILLSDADARQAFVAHLVLHGHLGMVAEEFRGHELLEIESTVEPHRLPLMSRFPPLFVKAILVAALAASLLAAIFYSLPKREGGGTRELAYDLQQIPIRTVGYLATAGNGQRVFPVAAGSNALVTARTEMTTANGTTIAVASGSLFGFSTEKLGLLFRGEVLVSSNAVASEYAVEMCDLRAVARNSTLRIDRRADGSAVVEAVDGPGEIRARYRVPRLFWSFDGAEEANGLPLVLGSQASRTAGLIGQGAIQLSGQREACVNIVGGTEEMVGSGLFSMSGGLTIEAVILSNWDAKAGNQDVIFRKEDGPNRILLSLQHNVNDFAIPKVPDGPVLSFGVFLRELGYSELDMPLDGREGRPRLDQFADGKPHHIAASYDSFSGTKSIAVDGRVCFSHQFPAGHCIQSGGPKPAIIGGWNKRETFDGVIDELAIYDYALSPDQIAQHHQRTQHGLRWLPEHSNPDRNWETIHKMEQGTSVVLDSHNKLQLPSIEKTSSF